MKRAIINLDIKAHKRWEFLKKHTDEINALLRFYLSDLSDAGIFKTYIEPYREMIISKKYQEEIKAVSNYCDFSEDEILITNLYYDALKFIFGCTAFSISNSCERWHARNLDWWTDGTILGDYSMIFDFQKEGETIYSLVSWPGFIGALSGVRKGAFSITLNAVLSNEGPQFATPITFLIRDVLEHITTYDEAIKKLSETTIASDCLLMVVGCNEGENVVIERTPTTYAIRKAVDNHLIVTNAYLALTENKITQDTLQATASGRHGRVKQLLGIKTPRTVNEYMNILSDSAIKMDITVQQMVLHPKTGNIHLKI